MRKRARVLAEAAEELEHEANVIDRDRPGWGEKLYTAVFEAFDTIEAFPGAGQAIADGGPERRFVLERFPCVLVYRETDTELVIVAVAYGGREPGYWRGR